MSDSLGKSAWRKKAAPKPETLSRLRAAKSRRKRAEEGGRVTITAEQSRFLAEVTINGGNVKAAAVTLGINVQTAKRWLGKPHIQALFERFTEEALSQVREWSTYLGRAQQTLADLLDSKDDRVRKDVAIYLTERAIGKVATKVEGTITHSVELSEVELAAALSLVASQGMPMMEARRYVREHPEEVREWAASQVAESQPLRYLEPIRDAEVVSSSALDVLDVPGASSHDPVLEATEGSTGQGVA